VSARSAPNATRGSVRGFVDRAQTLYRRPWRIDVVTRAAVRSPLPSAGIAVAVARALDAATAPAPGSVAIVLTDDAELAELNLEHMGIDGPTDVLSFPMLPPSAFSHGKGVPPAAVPVPAPGRRMHIGDIAISVERAIEQAEAGHGGQTGDVRGSAADELRLLVTHGVLHLCGWDHAEPAEEASMRALEQQLLQPRRRQRGKQVPGETAHRTAI
jgi:probable rRNA maturation factor